MQMGTYPERSIHLVLILAQVSLNAIGGDGVATVLAIDNDSLQLELLSSMLKHDRHEVIVAVQRDVALESLRSKVIDLVIVEPVSSRYDGTRLCHEIRQLSPETIELRQWAAALPPGASIRRRWTRARRRSTSLSTSMTL